MFEEKEKNKEVLAQVEFDGDVIHEDKNVLHVYIIATFLIVLLGLVVGFFFFGKTQEEKDANLNTTYGSSSAARLDETSIVYKNARSARDEKDFRRAVALYEEALLSDLDPNQKGQIKYEIAIAKDELNEEVEAIRLFKEVAGDKNVSELIRASAIEYMGRMYYSSYDRDIFEEVFKDAPYSGLKVETSIGESFKNLFEFGASLHPLAYSEIRVAKWYGAELFYNTELQGDEKRIAEIKELIKAGVARANKDFEELRKVYPTGGRITTFMLHRAILADMLERVGDPFLGDPEVLFREAIAFSTEQRSHETTSHLLQQFAVFLLYNRADTQEGDIKQTLSNFYDGGILSGERNPKFFEFLRNAKDTNGRTNEDIRRLAEIDSEYKALLTTLGWVF